MEAWKAEPAVASGVLGAEQTSALRMRQREGLKTHGGLETK